MRIKQIEVFQYEKLEEKAKEKARNWYRDVSYDDNFWADCVVDDAKEIAKLMGWSVDKIYWTGFNAQEDGACFVGSMGYAKGCTKRVKAYAPRDTELHRIAKAWYDLQRKNFYAIRASVKHSGHYYHEFCTSFNVEDTRDNYGYWPENHAKEIQDEVQSIARDFMQWIYNQLEREYRYQTSDEVIEENIIAHEYEFDIEGNRI